MHEGEGRGNDRRQRVDVYLNFIGAFEVPAHIVTPAEEEEERRRREEKVAREARAEELEKTGADLTPEEAERLAAYRRKKADQQRARRERVKAGNPEAVARYENHLAARREAYHRKKREAGRSA